ncbi:methionyl-tRNA formyltransferase [Ostreibacterium oceani]|uniref:Methionyl-tRNA formyltransferase n=1 Tax=Ostreibacterium oceani TaxID=2654998 RepID=A0A6N7EYE8_9GAMM|nr:methionyl-tRNA formyltransferase [Ostreibacterium oceani]MPV86157.1 methionyl-tRNA formyltransferase [Ostreibacterium oceani]
MTRIVFAGTPEFAATHLQALIEHGHQPSLVLTQPDRSAGRGKKLSQSPVKTLAATHQIPVLQPEKFDGKAQQTLLALPSPDIFVVVAYGLLLPQWLLDWARCGAINVHASLLPRWRGAAPIQRAIAAGDSMTGVAIMQMQTGLDTGPVWAQTQVPITPQTTAGALHDTLQAAGSKLLLATLPRMLAQTDVPTPQSEIGVTYAKKLTKQEAQINWQQDAVTICRKINAFNPVPVSHCHGKNFASAREIALRIFAAQAIEDETTTAVGTILCESPEGIVIKCHHGAIRVTELQEIGKKRLSVKEFLNGKSLAGFVFS